MKRLMEGVIVHYVAYNQRHLAAMVIGVQGDTVDLAVFTNMENAAGNKNFGVQFHQDVKFSLENEADQYEPGTYHYMTCNK